MHFLDEVPLRAALATAQKQPVSKPLFQVLLKGIQVFSRLARQVLQIISLRGAAEQTPRIAALADLLQRGASESLHPVVEKLPVDVMNPIAPESLPPLADGAEDFAGKGFPIGAQGFESTVHGPDQTRLLQDEGFGRLGFQPVFFGQPAGNSLR